MKINILNWFVFYDQKTLVQQFRNPVVFSQTVDSFNILLKQFYKNSKQWTNIPIFPQAVEQDRQILQLLTRCNTLLLRFFQVQSSITQIQDVKKFASKIVDFQKIQLLYMNNFWKNKYDTFVQNRVLSSLVRLNSMVKLLIKHQRDLQIKYQDNAQIQDYMKNISLIFLFLQKSTREIIQKYLTQSASNVQFIIFKIFLVVNKRSHKDLLASQQQNLKRLLSQQNLSALIYKIMYQNQIYFLNKESVQVIDHEQFEHC